MHFCNASWVSEFGAEENRTLSNPHLSLPDLPNSRAVLLFMPTRMVKLPVPCVVVQEILTLHAVLLIHQNACVRAV
jgi:hypothetical protein